MDPATIALIVNAAITYGIPFAQQVIGLFSKKEVTQADWDALWASAATPYGLTPDAAIISKWESKTGGVPATVPADVPAGAVFVTRTIGPNGDWTLCDVAGHCTGITAENVSKCTTYTTPSGAFVILTPDGKTFWLRP